MQVYLLALANEFAMSGEEFSRVKLWQRDPQLSGMVLLYIKLCGSRMQAYFSDHTPQLSMAAYTFGCEPP